MATGQELLRRRRNSWEVCAGAAREMEEILSELEEYSGVYEETTALRKQLDCIEKTCAREQAACQTRADEAQNDSLTAENDPKAVARTLIAQMPLQRIFEDPALADAFLSELLLALARESSGRDRRERQRQGIAQAKAQGVRFGAPKRPLPANFESVRMAWRNGAFSLTEAAERCGMAKTTFYNAAQRAERTLSQPEKTEPVTRKRGARPSASAQAN